MKRALLIGGVDPSAGAGIILDAFVASRLGFAPCCATTVVTAQNSGAFSACEPVSLGMLRAELHSLAEDGPFGFAKIGAVGSAAHAEVIREFLSQAAVGPIVFDPVLASTSGGALVADDPEKLAPLIGICDLITPNLNEAAALCGRKPLEPAAPDEATVLALKSARRFGVNVLVTGVGLSETAAADILADTSGSVCVLEHRLVPEAGDPRGTGCAFATAIAGNLDQAEDIATAVRQAQVFLLDVLMCTYTARGGRRQLDLSSAFMRP